MNTRLAINNNNNNNNTFYSLFVYIDTVLNGHLCFYKLEKWNSQYTYVYMPWHLVNQ